MSTRTTHYLACDICDATGPRSRTDTLDARRKGIKAGWVAVAFDMYGNEGHCCPSCVEDHGDREERLRVAIMRKGEEMARGTSGEESP